MKIKKYGMLISLLAMTATTYAAQGEGFYVGGQLGYTNVKNNPKNLQTMSGTTVLVHPKNTGLGGRFFFGYNVNQYGAFETGWTYFAPSTYDPKNSTICGTPSIRQNSLDILAKGMIPFSSTNFDVFGKAGFAIVRNSMAGSLKNATVNPCGSTNGTTTTVRPVMAIGASYALTQNWIADLSWTRIFGGGTIKTSDLYALGIAYHIVDTKCGQFLC